MKKIEKNLKSINFALDCMNKLIDINDHKQVQAYVKALLYVAYDLLDTDAYFKFEDNIQDYYADHNLSTDGKKMI